MASKRQRRPWQRLLFGDSQAKRKPERRSSPFARRLLSEALEDRRMLAAGDPDPNFGDPSRPATDLGEVTITVPPNRLSDQFTTSIIDSQGRTLIAGSTINSVAPKPSLPNADFVVVRVNQNGTVDTGFNNGVGKFELGIGLSEDRLTGIALQVINGQQRILLSGYYDVSGNDLTVTFDDGAASQVTSTRRAFTDEDVGMQIRITSAGRWVPGTYTVTAVAAGVASLDDTVVATPGDLAVSGNWFADKYDMAVIRLMPDGTFDPSFGRAGFALIPIAPFRFLNQGVDVPQLDTFATSIAIDTSDPTNPNRIVVAGYTEVPRATPTQIDNDFAVIRLTQTGVIDTTFNDNSAAQGKLIIPIENNSVDDEANAVVVDSSGNVLLAGFTAGANNSDFAFARVFASGAPDPGFDVDGKMKIDFGTVSNVTRDVANSVILLNDGSIVAAGETGSRLANAPRDFGVVKLSSSGAPLVAFGTNGRVIFPASSSGNSDEVANSIAFQPTGNGNTANRLVVGGTRVSNNNADFLTIRLDPVTGALDTTWGNNGSVVTAFGSRNDVAAKVNVMPTGIPNQTTTSTGQTINISNVGKVVVTGTTDLNATGANDFAFAAVRYLNDGPSLPRFTITPSVTTVTEGLPPTTVTFTVTLSAAVPQQTSVSYTVTGTATSGSDFTIVPAAGTLVFGPNVTQQTIVATILNDTLPEIDETIIVTLTNAAPSSVVQVGTPLSATVTILDNDPGLSIVSSVIQPEGNTSVNNFMVFPVTLRGLPPAAPVTVAFTVTPGTATAGSDYTAISGVLNFPAGTTVQNISVPIVGDLTGEPDETFTVTLSSPVGAQIIAGQGASTGTIRNDDGAPIFLNIADPAPITEGDSGTRNLVFTVTRTGGGTNSVVVDYTTVDGSALGNADFLPRSGKLTFSSSTTTRTITVPVIGDLLAEGPETFQVSLSNATNGGTIQDGDATGAILDTDIDVAEVVISDARITESETTQNMIFLVQLTKPLSQPVTVQFITLNAGATSPSDFIGVPVGSPQTITIPANSVLQTIAIPIVGDGIAESFEEFVVRLTSATTTAPASVSIRDADGKGSIVDNDLTGSIYVNDITVYEPGTGVTNAVFTVSLSRAVNTTVTVNFSTAPGTATSPTDFTATSGVVTFPPGVTSRTVSVPVLADADNSEGSQNFMVNLSSPSNGRIFDGQGVATIIDSAAGVAPDVVIDDGDGGFSTNGAWTNGSNTQAYQLDFKSIQPGNSSAQATWSAPVAAGTYEVFTRWVPFVNRAAAVTYTILQNNTPLRVAVVSQLVAPNDVVARGVTWESLGTVTLTADGVLRVRVNGNSSGIVTADAVRFVPVTVAPLQMAPLSASLIATSATAAASQTSPATTTPESSAPAAGSLAAYVANQPSTGPAVAAPATFIGPRRLTAAQEAAFSSLLFLEDLQLEWLK